jgi:hypothetical protein
MTTPWLAEVIDGAELREELDYALLSVFDSHGADRLLERLLKVHREPRYDIAPEIAAASQAAVRRVEALVITSSIALAALASN